MNAQQEHELTDKWIKLAARMGASERVHTMSVKKSELVDIVEAVLAVKPEIRFEWIETTLGYWQLFFGGESIGNAYERCEGVYAAEWLTWQRTHADSIEEAKRIVEEKITAWYLGVANTTEVRG